MILGEIVKEYRDRHGLSMDAFSEISGLTKGYISMLEKNEHPKSKKPIQPTLDTLEKVSKGMKMSVDELISELDPEQEISINITSEDYIERLSADTSDSLLTEISNKVAQLSTKGQKSVLRFTSELLEREEADRIVQEEPIFKVYFRSAAKAGPKGYGYDDYDADYAYTDQQPPRHDVATKVDGDSMNPDYQDGDILYLRDYGASHYNGEECVVVIDDKSYFKRLYTTEEGLRLVSTNPDKDTYPDLHIDFPPSDGSHIKIFNVVGSFTPVEK